MPDNKMTKLVPLERLDSDQVINIPEEMEFDTEEVVIYRNGDTLIVEPKQGDLLDKTIDGATNGSD